MTQRQPTESRQRQIAEAALKIIATQGLGKFRTAAIAEEVGLAEGTIFRHFSNKTEIVLAAITLMEEKLEEGFPPEHEDPLERLGIFMRRRLELVLSHPGVFRAFFSDQLAQAAGEEGLARVSRIKKESTEFALSCLMEASQKGQLRAGVEPQFLVRMIQGTAHAFLFGPLPMNWTEGDPAALAERVWKTIRKLIGR